MSVNDTQRCWVVNRVRDHLGDIRGRTIGLWGLTFKPNTDDVRESPALDIAQRLVNEGATLRAYDPMAGKAAGDVGLPVTICTSAYEAVLGADAILLATEWEEFLTIRWDRVAHLMRGVLIFDGRNCLDADEVSAAGLQYAGVGRPSIEPCIPRQVMSA